jgi:hypothetical protein
VRGDTGADLVDRCGFENAANVVISMEKDWQHVLVFKYPLGYSNSLNFGPSGLNVRGMASLAMTLGETERASAEQSPVTAIDIALEPDQTMIGHAKAANATLLKNFPKGFSLNETHHPHVSIFAGFVPTADLPKVYAAAGEVLAKEKYTTWKLTAFKYYYIPLGPIGLAGIVIEPTPDLLCLQQKLTNAQVPTR